MMEPAWLWIVSSIVLALMFLYPYAIYPIILRLLPKKPYVPDVAEAGCEFSVALVFCAHNEADALPKKIDNIRALKRDWPRLQVYAYSDCSSDATNELLCRANDVLTPVIGQTRVGKAAGMRALVAMTDADIVVFTDANVIMDPNSIGRLCRYFQDPDIGTVAGTLVYQLEDDERPSSTAQVGGFYWRLEERIKKLESRTGSTPGADGSLFARRREGYPKVPIHLLDDLTASISVMFHGLRCVSAPDVVAYEQSVSVSSEEFRRKRRIACRAFNTYRYLYPKIKALSPLDRFKFFSHKVMRWWGAAYLSGACVCLLAAGWTAGYPLLTSTIGAAVVSVIWTLGAIGFPIFLTLREVLQAVVATGIGVLESFAGRTYQTWTPAQSR